VGSGLELKLGSVAKTSVVQMICPLRNIDPTCPNYSGSNLITSSDFKSHLVTVTVTGTAGVKKTLLGLDNWIAAAGESSDGFGRWKETVQT